MLSKNIMVLIPKNKKYKIVFYYQAYFLYFNKKQFLNKP